MKKPVDRTLVALKFSIVATVAMVAFFAWEGHDCRAHGQCPQNLTPTYTQGACVCVTRAVVP